MAEVVRATVLHDGILVNNKEVKAGWATDFTNPTSFRDGDDRLLLDGTLRNGVSATLLRRWRRKPTALSPSPLVLETEEDHTFGENPYGKIIKQFGSLHKPVLQAEFLGHPDRNTFDHLMRIQAVHYELNRVTPMDDERRGHIIFSGPVTSSSIKILQSPQNKNQTPFRAALMLGIRVAPTGEEGREITTFVATKDGIDHLIRVYERQQHFSTRADAERVIPELAEMSLWAHHRQQELKALELNIDPADPTFQTNRWNVESQSPSFGIDFRPLAEGLPSREIDEERERLTELIFTAH